MDKMYYKVIALLPILSLIIYNSYWLVNGANILHLLTYYTIQTNIMVIYNLLTGKGNKTYIAIYLIPTFLSFFYFLTLDHQLFDMIFITIDHLITPGVFIIYSLVTGWSNIKWDILIYPMIYITWLLIFTALTGKVLYPFLDFIN